MPTVIEQRDYICTDNGSNKEYHVRLESNEDGTWSTHTLWGARGSSLTPGVKANSVSMLKARRAFDAECNKRLSKGYRLSGQPAAVYAGAPSDDTQTDVRPQLLNAIDENQLEEITRDDRWIFQEKKDGKRIMIRKLLNDNGSTKSIQAINRKGKIVSIPQAILDEIDRIPREITIDGELIGDVYYAFDIVSWKGTTGDAGQQGFGRRLAALLRVAASLTWGLNGLTEIQPVMVVPGFNEEAEKRQFVQDARDQNCEGIVGKDRESVYTPGRPNSGGPALKFKFKARVTCEVDTESTGKRSVYLLVRDGRFTFSSKTRVGKVTIPPNFEVPEPRELVDIEYLYAFPSGGSLFQPVYLGERDDLEAPDDYSSLKFKQSSGEEDDES